jgi:hypothetical protein
MVAARAATARLRRGLAYAVIALFLRTCFCRAAVQDPRASLRPRSLTARTSTGS